MAAAGTTAAAPARRRRGRRTPRRVAVVTAAVAVGTAAAVLAPGGPGGGGVARAAALQPFANCDALRSWYAAAAVEQVGPYGLGGVGGPAMPVDIGGRDVAVAAGPRAESAAGGTTAGGDARAAAPSSAVGPGATGTNVQEAGVDEPDVAKTDGSLLLTVDGSRLHLLDVSGDAPRRVGRLDLPDGTALELLLAGDLAVVLGTRWDAPVPVGPLGTDGPSRRPVPGVGTTTVTVVDVADPASPTVVGSHEVEGGYLSAREHDGTVRVVVRSQPDLPFTYPEGDRDEAAAAAANREVVRSATAADWLPRRVVRDGSGRVTGVAPLLDCDAVSHPGSPAGVGTLTVLTLDPAGSAEPEAVAVASDGDLVYSSPDRLYVATARGGWWRLSDGGRPEEDVTEVHAFDVGGDATGYVASGEVEGYLLGRWAMSEKDARLRVATTRGDAAGWWSGPGDGGDSDSAVSVLEERGDRLELVGSVDGLGRGERVRAVRWFGDVATVVTFRETDPLYTVDLSDPAAPRVLGELEVPGYSAYLHPVGDGLLLGVGQDATDRGELLGLQLSTFDLTDLSAPFRVDVLTRARSGSEVEGDSRAFSYLPDRRLALLPVWGETGGSTLLAVGVGADGALTEAAEWGPARPAWSLRAVPVDDGRLAALVHGERGRSLVLLELDGLTALGEVALG